MGQCPECQEWNSLVEEVIAKKTPVENNNRAAQRSTWLNQHSKPQKIEELLKQNLANEQKNRWQLNMEELNRVLGGGLVPGSLILLGGAPGVGKSTLLLHVANSLSKDNKNVLYMTGEESTQQTALRAQRLGLSHNTWTIWSESNTNHLLKELQNNSYDLVIVDSIQTLFCEELSSSPGSVAQVRECVHMLMQVAKSQEIAIITVGHITKEGSIAGPKVVEHMVDTVLLFEGDHTQQYRLLRSQKNRFGPAHELGVFEMTSSGLKEVTNPSELFIEERDGILPSGLSVFSSVEGTRPFLCEVQALCTKSSLHHPRRTVVGFDPQRLHLILAVLQRYLNLDLSQHDVFVSLAGGIRVQEPAVDLAVAAALISSAFNQPISNKICFSGEIGLTGEIRPVSFLEARLKESTRQGFEELFTGKVSQKLSKDLNHRLCSVQNLNELKEKLFATKPKDSGTTVMTTDYDADLPF